MKIFLTGKRGSKSAFKISTAHVHTNIDPVVEDYLNNYLKLKADDPNYYKSFKNFIDYATQSYSMDRIYVGDTEIDAPVRKLSTKVWVEIINTYAETYPDKYAKFCLSE